MTGADSEDVKHPLRRSPLSKEVPKALAYFKRPRLTVEHLEMALGCQNGDPDDENTWSGGRVEWTVSSQST
jgi:hypothetical protein